MQPTHATLCRYNYDALDRLINQHQPNAPTHQRFYCKSRLATEIHGTLGHSIIQHDDLLLAEQKRDGSSTDTVLLATDLQRSVLNTMKQGVAPQPIAYSPYGHRPTLGGLLSLLGFNGERPDPLTGHYLLGNGYRAFNPVLMRFNSPDSLSPFGKGGLNCYMYCSGDPTNRVDTTGHWYKSILLSLKRALPEEHFAPIARALQKTKSSMGGIAAIEQTAITTNKTNAVVLFESAITDQANEVMHYISTSKTVLAARDSRVKNISLLQIKTELEQATNIATELSHYAPKTHEHQNAMKIVAMGKQTLDSRLNIPDINPSAPSLIRST